MKAEIQTRIDQIRRRFEEYLKHKNDPYSYYPGEIEEVREFNSHAVEDVEFLLDLVSRAKRVFYHDDPPCQTRLNPDGTCPRCDLRPDMQSTCFLFHCPDCDYILKHLKCPKCQRIFRRPS